MKRFEVGKYYENNDIFGRKFFTWQCTKINDKRNRATFNLVGYRYTKDGGKSYTVVKDLDPCKILCRICEAEYRDTEEAYNNPKALYLEADRAAV